MMSGIGSRNPYTGKWETNDGNSKAELQDKLKAVTAERDQLLQKVAQLQKEIITMKGGEKEPKPRKRLGSRNPYTGQWE